MDDLGEPGLSGFAADFLPCRESPARFSADIQIVLLHIRPGRALRIEGNPVLLLRGRQQGRGALLSPVAEQLQAEPVQNQPQLQSTVFRLPRDIPGVDDVESIAAAASVQTEKLLLGERGALSSARRLRYTGELRRLRVFLLTSVFPL